MLNWRITALQHRLGFCHIATWISRRNTYLPSPLEPASPLWFSRLENPTDRGVWRGSQSMGSDRVRQDWATKPGICSHSLSLVADLCDSCLLFVSPIVLIQVQPLYNDPLLSTAQPSESAVRIHMSPPFLGFCFPFRSPHSNEESSLCDTVASHKLPTSFRISVVYMCELHLPIHPTNPPPVGVHIHIHSHFLFSWPD